MNTFKSAWQGLVTGRETSSYKEHQNINGRYERLKSCHTAVAPNLYRTYFAQDMNYDTDATGLQRVAEADFNAAQIRLSVHRAVHS